MFDIDGNGFIGIEQIRAVFNKGCFASIDEAMWDELFEELKGISFGFQWKIDLFFLGKLDFYKR